MSKQQQSPFQPSQNSGSSTSRSSAQHWAFLIGAGALAAYGLTRRSKSGIALATAGSALAYKAARNQIASSNQYTARSVAFVTSSPEEAYKLWRDFANLPRFMSHLDSVRILDDRRSEWVAKGPLDSKLRWTAEIMTDTPGQRIAWRSLPDSDISNSGSVDFTAAKNGRGTFITANVNYSLPGGPIARGIIAGFGKHPDFVVKEDLRRFKALLEAGEAPTTRGQSHGPRSAKSKLHESLLQEDTHPEPQAGQGARLRTA